MPITAGELHKHYKDLDNDKINEIVRLIPDKVTRNQLLWAIRGYGAIPPKTIILPDESLIVDSAGVPDLAELIRSGIRDKKLRAEQARAEEVARFKELYTEAFPEQPARPTRGAPVNVSAWANEEGYAALTINDRQHYDWLRPHKEDWESGETTNKDLAIMFVKSVDTIRGWRRDLKDRGCPAMDWKRQESGV